MRKIVRRLHPKPKLSGTQSLRLSREPIRTLTADELPLAAGGGPTGSWPSDGTYRTANQVSGGGC